MKNTMIVKGIVIVCLGIVTMIGCCTVTCAQDITNNDIENTTVLADEGNGNGMAVTVLTGVATAAPYLAAPAAVLVNTTVGMIAGIFLPDHEEAPRTATVVQIAANEGD